MTLSFFCFIFFMIFQKWDFQNLHFKNLAILILMKICTMLYSGKSYMMMERKMIFSILALPQALDTVFKIIFWKKSSSVSGRLYFCHRNEVLKFVLKKKSITNEAKFHEKKQIKLSNFGMRLEKMFLQLKAVLV